MEMNRESLRKLLSDHYTNYVKRLYAPEVSLWDILKSHCPSVHPLVCASMFYLCPGHNFVQHEFPFKLAEVFAISRRCVGQKKHTLSLRSRSHR